MSSKHRKQLYEPDHYDQSWLGGVTIGTIIFALLIAAGLCWLTGCSPKIVERKVTKIEYRDRIVRDTATEFREINVQDWIDNDESLDGVKGY